jgi:diaminohydroxyphosphoribosylaminopyrimidine deaminase/5-amino-6-(5-phosphoribosylamino)uracil reductase
MPRLTSCAASSNLTLPVKKYVFVSPLLLGGPRLALGDLGISTLADRIDIDIQSVTYVGRDLLIEATPRKAA